MNDDQPKISIVIPVLNRAVMLKKAIQSVLDQRYPNLELIVIDGESTDGTLDVIQQYASSIAYWHSKKDSSSYQASNTGIEKATGDVIGLLMADDWYEPDTFFKLAAAYKADASANIFTFASRIVTATESNVYQTQQTYYTEKSLRLNYYNICYGGSYVCSRFYKKEIFQRSGSFKALSSSGKRFFSNDLEFLLRILLDGVKNKFISHVGCTYLSHKESATLNNDRQTIMRLCEEHIELVPEFISHYHKKISLSQKAVLIYWYNDESVRLMLYQLLEKKYVNAIQTVFAGIKRHPLSWCLVGLYTLPAIFIKRTFRLILTGKFVKQYKVTEGDLL